MKKSANLVMRSWRRGAVLLTVLGAMISVCQVTAEILIQDYGIVLSGQ